MYSTHEVAFMIYDVNEYLHLSNYLILTYISNLFVYINMYLFMNN